MPQGLKDIVRNAFACLMCKRGVAAGVCALVAAGIAMSLTAGMAVAAGELQLADPSYPEGTAEVADDSTMDNYKVYPTGQQSTSYDTTQFAGRLWTDKTVVAPTTNGTTVGATATFDLADQTRVLDEANHTTAAGKFEVDKTASGTFLTSISALSSSLATELVEPVPLDIVLVLDLSGSMTENNSAKLNDLKNAVSEFIGTISEMNTDLAEQGYTTDSMSQIGIVKFNGNYLGPVNWAERAPVYTIDWRNPSNLQSRIITPLTCYTENGVDGTTLEQAGLTTVSGLTASGATAAEIGMTLGLGVFDGKATIGGVEQPGARKGVQKVVIFFTDGAPNSYVGSGVSAPRDFCGRTAQDAWAIAHDLKQEGALIYSVAIADEANASTTANNLNMFLHGMSSNYPDAAATGGVRPSNGSGLALRTDAPAATSWIPVLGERAKDSDYYLVAGGTTSISDIFRRIASEITSDEGGDSTSTGRDGNTAVTITDYLGDYMEFKGLDGILYGITADTTEFYAPGTQGAYHKQAQVQRDDASATQSTYTLWPKDLVPSALLNPSEGQEYVSLNLITVKVTRSSDAKTGDTVTITIPPELIPSIRYAVKQKQEEDHSISNEVTRSLVDPLRIFYSVGPKANTLSGVISQLEDQALRSENATNESDRQTAAYKSFLSDAAQDGDNGIYNLYSNSTPEGDAPSQGTTVVSMTLAETNPYYFYVEEPVFVKTSSNPDIYREAKDSNYETGMQLYVMSRYWNVDTNAETMTYVPWDGTPTLNEDDGVYYVPAGTPKLAESDWTSTSIPKASGANKTETATTSLESSFTGVTDSSGNLIASQHLGNNGVLRLPVKGTLAVNKNIKAGDGFDLPTDPVPTASFTLRIYDAQGQALMQDGTYRALIRDADGHPIDPATHAPVTSADSAKFYVVYGSTFELRDGETIKVTNLPDGATYQVNESGQAGYSAVVINNDGTREEFARGADASTAPASATP